MLRFAAGVVIAALFLAACGDRVQITLRAADSGTGAGEDAGGVEADGAAATFDAGMEPPAVDAAVESGAADGAGTVLDSGDACAPLPETEAPMAPELEGGLAWLNVDAPLRIEDLRGHVVMLDFWTYGCINCLHQMPVLREIEDALEGEPFVLIGVHSAKFFSEREARNINLAMQQYNVRHPVVVDSQLAIWDAYRVNAWPTTILIDAQGRRRYRGVGEYSASFMLSRIESLVNEAKRTCTAETEPVSYLREPTAGSTEPLLFPNGVLALPDGRVAIADSAHHRVVIMADGGTVDEIVGNGIEGLVDGQVANAQFARPTGLAWYGDTLYVADPDNHVIRAVDLEARQVETVAGTGSIGRRTYTLGAGEQPALEASIRSPWDLEPVEGGLAVAMAGSHQIYLFDPVAETIRVLSGSGIEALSDGPAGDCTYAQPSGLSLSPDGQTLYVADSESSSIRAVSVADGACTTLVGRGLFVAGDQDGIGDAVRLQHATGVETLADGTLVVADTYNGKMKRLDPATRQVMTLPFPPAQLALDEPRGLSRLAETLYLTDTNHHRILVHDLGSGETNLFDLGNLEAPALFGSSR